MRYFVLFVVCSFFLMTCSSPKEPLLEVEKWGVFEVELEGPSTGNPYLEVEVKATFSNGNQSIDVPGFYDGNGVYIIRFSPHNEGEWRYQTQSNTDILSDKKGGFICGPPNAGNHGPVGVANTFYLQYADGTPFNGVGTTAYQWTSVKQSIQEQTVASLSDAPFNKIRMCVFPKKYRYGNDTEPWQYPFVREDTVDYYDQPNYDFFQNFDHRIRQLLGLDIQADVILFHPYDQDWGYFMMGSERNERYVRYMIARISAYRNVWWSLANEWDIPAIKDTVDWESIGTLLHWEDPHQRLRGIHNWYNSEDHFYDHSRSWITHTSTQTSQFFNALRWRDRYQKPLLFDEMRYEGDVPSGWGNMSGEEMASYFWMAGLSGGHGTHGETLQNSSDSLTEVRWWAKGGLLEGTSPDRIAYFRKTMESAPFHEMSPSLIVNGDSSNLDNNVHLLTSTSGYQLAYAADANIAIKTELPPGSEYDVEVIDTWNMEVIDTQLAAEGTFSFTTPAAYTALRIVPKTQ